MNNVVGVAWLTPDEWAKLRDIAPDADQFQPTFDDWRAVLEKSLADLRAKGLRLQRVPISVAALQAWCEIRGRRPDADARAEYTASELQRINESGSSPLDA
jgi:hypothetical protein